MRHDNPPRRPRPDSHLRVAEKVVGVKVELHRLPSLRGEGDFQRELAQEIHFCDVEDVAEAADSVVVDAGHGADGHGIIEAGVGPEHSVADEGDRTPGLRGRPGAQPGLAEAFRFVKLVGITDEAEDHRQHPAVGEPVHVAADEARRGPAFRPVGPAAVRNQGDTGVDELADSRRADPLVVRPEDRIHLAEAVIEQHAPTPTAHRHRREGAFIGAHDEGVPHPIGSGRTLPAERIALVPEDLGDDRLRLAHAVHRETSDEHVG